MVLRVGKECRQFLLLVLHACVTAHFPQNNNFPKEMDGPIRRPLDEKFRSIDGQESKGKIGLANCSPGHPEWLDSTPTLSSFPCRSVNVNVPIPRFPAIPGRHANPKTVKRQGKLCDWPAAMEHCAPGTLERCKGQGDRGREGRSERTALHFHWERLETQETPSVTRCSCDQFQVY